jgi:hypothetical protein
VFDELIYDTDANLTNVLIGQRTGHSNSGKDPDRLRCLRDCGGPYGSRKRHELKRRPHPRSSVFPRRSEIASAIQKAKQLRPPACRITCGLRVAQNRTPGRRVHQGACGGATCGACWSSVRKQLYWTEFSLAGLLEIGRTLQSSKAYRDRKRLSLICAGGRVNFGLCHMGQRAIHAFVLPKIPSACVDSEWLGVRRCSSVYRTDTFLRDFLSFVRSHEAVRAPAVEVLLDYEDSVRRAISAEPLTSPGGPRNRSAAERQTCQDNARKCDRAQLQHPDGC